MSDHQAGPSSATSDLTTGKTYRPGYPYRRDEGNPGVVTGLVHQVVGYLVAHETATVREMAEALTVDPKKVTDSLKHLKSRGEVELAVEPTTHTEPRVWRLVRPSPTPEQVATIEGILHTDRPGSDPEQMKTPIEELAAAEPETTYVTPPKVIEAVSGGQPLLPPTQQDMDDAMADLLAMHSGETGVDPVSAALNKVLLAAEQALACYLEHFEDPLRRHLERQVEEAHAAISAWEDRRRDR